MCNENDLNNVASFMDVQLLFISDVSILASFVDVIPVEVFKMFIRRDTLITFTQLL